jgi:hypothetical protein
MLLMQAPATHTRSAGHPPNLLLVMESKKMVLSSIVGYVGLTSKRMASPQLLSVCRGQHNTGSWWLVCSAAHPEQLHASAAGSN